MGSKRLHAGGIFLAHEFMPAQLELGAGQAEDGFKGSGLADETVEGLQAVLAVDEIDRGVGKQVRGGDGSIGLFEIAEGRDLIEGKAVRADVAVQVGGADGRGDALVEPEGQVGVEGVEEQVSVFVDGNLDPLRVANFQGGDGVAR